MSDLPNRQDLFAVGRRSIVTTPGLRINPKVIDIEGSDLNLLIGAMSLLGEDVVAAFVMCIAGLYVETAVDEHLDRVAFDRYQLTRFPATPATVTLTLSRPTFAAGAGTFPTGSRVQTPAGVQFATDVDVTFGAVDLVKTVTATALLAGPDSNVPATSISQFVDQPFDTTITVVNVAGAAGGTDAEDNPTFRARILGFFPTIRRGTLGAIEYGATQVPGVAVATAYEVVNTIAGEGFPAGMVQLIVADANGGASDTMLQAVKDILLTYRAAGIPVVVTGGTVVPQPVTWSLSFETGVDQAQAVEEVRAVTVAVGQFLKPGETLHRSSLIAGARSVPGVIVRDNSLVVPAGDTVPSTAGAPDNTKIIRINPTDVTFE